MAVAFDVSGTDTYLPIKYQQKRLSVPAGSEIQNADFDKLLLTKFTAWRYESEYRCFCPLSESINEDGLYFKPFSTHLKLAQVIVGARSKITRTKLAAALGAEHSHVAYFKAQPAFGTFLVVRNCNNSLWQ